MKTQRSILAALLLLLISINVMSQAPRVDVFGGYSYGWLGVDPSAAVPEFSHANMNGWNASATWNVRRFFGITSDFSGSYRSEPEKVLQNGNSFMLIPASSESRHFFLFGPTFSFSGPARSRIFTHALLGPGHQSALPNTFLATALGGGVDVGIRPRFALRLGQADYLHSRFRPPLFCPLCPDCTCPPEAPLRTRNDLRLSFGLVFRMGEH